jgi:hypothetical protein
MALAPLSVRPELQAEGGVKPERRPPTKLLKKLQVSGNCPCMSACSGHGQRKPISAVQATMRAR